MFPTFDELVRPFLWMRKADRLVCRAEGPAATLPELEAALPGAEPSFVLSCLRQCMTIAKARTAWANTGRDGDPIAAFNAAVEEQTAKGADRQRAIAIVATKHPELHQAFLQATNPGVKIA